ncbi:hypothetical protein GCM10008026_31630 [Chelatococcus composti]|nr:hypothetical protein GCM10008026_31630 [Chelatococcus composti]
MRQSNLVEMPATLPMQVRVAPVSSADAEARTVEVVFTTGAAVRRRRWTGWDTPVPFDEILVVSRDAVDLSRLNAGGPALDSHSMWSTFAQVGVVDRAWIEGGQGRATIRFPSKGVDERADRMFAMVSEGIIRNVSVGYSVDKVRVIPPEKVGDVEKRIVERWTPHEISFVTVPADAGAQVRSQSTAVFPVEFITRAEPVIQEEPAMPERVDSTAGSEPAPIAERTAPSPVATEDAEKRAAAAIEAERKRSAEITALAQRHDMPADFASRHIAEGTPLDRVRELVLEEVAQRAEKTRISPRTQVVTDEGDTLRRAIEAAVALRANPQAIVTNDEASRTLVAAAREWRGMSLLEMGRAFVEDTHGVRLRGLSKRELAGVLLGLTRAAGMMSTSDFPNLLANVASKRLRDAYRAAPQTWRPLCRQSNAPDFKERAIVQLAGMPEFQRVREGGEYTYASLSESVERYSIATYGRIIAITRQTLINDDLGAFDRLPSLFGRAAAELENDLVWDILMSNPQMSDGKALFHTDHNNLASSGGAPSEATVEAAEIAIGEQKDAAGKPMNLRPRFLIVPPKYKVAAQKLLASVTATKTGDVNVYQNAMDLIIEQRLKPASGTVPWFMAVDPAQWDTIEYAYLEGEEGLYTEERMGFEVDGIEIKGRLDFGAKAIDYRGFYKNPGVS